VYARRSSCLPCAHGNAGFWGAVQQC